ncbi:MAG TPA: hypothetical protein VEY67_06900, partial [Candidatus Dormibacteraeota bacterium]|nr:hypothetical protein [Candidatus Dormibacteraeota bacterium]
FVVGGQDASGKPTTTVYELAPNTQTGDLGTWRTVDAAALPEGRSAASLAVATDGLILVGGDNGSGPTNTVWKSTFDTKGQPGAWKPGAPLIEPRSGALASVVGQYIWVYGGSDAKGATAIVQRGLIEAAALAANAPAGSPAPPSAVTRWAVQGAGSPVNLPAPRTDPAGFAANGALYLVGGTDGSGPKSDVWWTTPTADGQIPGWQHLGATDLPKEGLAGSAATVSGGTAFLVGGTTTSGVIAQAVRASLSPKAPFFQLGLLGATVPALKIEGEIGQQLGYLNAAGVGTIDFILLLLIGYVLAHREQTRAAFERLRRRRAG